MAGSNATTANQLSTEVFRHEEAPEKSMRAADPKDMADFMLPPRPLDAAVDAALGRGEEDKDWEDADRRDGRGGTCHNFRMKHFFRAFLL